MKYLILRIWCLLGIHDWTCNAKKGIKPTTLQLSTGTKGFDDYATMYCDHCGKISRYSK